MDVNMVLLIIFPFKVAINVAVIRITGWNLFLKSLFMNCFSKKHEFFSLKIGSLLKKNYRVENISL